MSQSEEMSGYDSIDEPTVSPDTARLVEDTGDARNTGTVAFHARSI